jgi:hypothetical protein
MNKTKLKEKCKAILSQDFMIDSDKEFLMNLFTMHPSFEQKKGDGIKDIKIKRTIYGNNCFYIERTDGSGTDISYLKCINGRPTKISEIKKACRTAIRSEVVKIKNSVNYGIDTCQFTGEVLNENNTHIDHYNLKFNEVVNNWLKLKDVEFLASKLNNKKDNEVEVFFIDENIIADFLEYHNKNTHLRAVSKKANLTILK